MSRVLWVGLCAAVPRQRHSEYVRLDKHAYYNQQLSWTVEHSFGFCGLYMVSEISNSMHNFANASRTRLPQMKFFYSSGDNKMYSQHICLIKAQAVDQHKTNQTKPCASMALCLNQLLNYRTQCLHSYSHLSTCSFYIFK